jgi:hypothetical protein
MPKVEIMAATRGPMGTLKKDLKTSRAVGWALRLLGISANERAVSQREQMMR